MSKVFYCVSVLFFSACCSRKINLVEENSNNSMVKNLPSIIIYKTKANYSNYVPIGLSSDKKEIVSYPHPKDLIGDNGLKLPRELKNSYWMDELGIGTNMAYLNISLQDYASLKKPLSIKEMKKMIIDFDPFIEMWSCGLRGSITEEEINTRIVNGNLDSSFTRIR